MEISELVKDICDNCIKMQKKAFPKGQIITTYMEKRKQICILLSGKADLIRYDLNGNKDIIESFVFTKMMYLEKLFILLVLIMNYLLKQLISAKF